MSDEKQIYLNNKQLEYLGAPQKICMLLWGRGTGKSFVDGHKQYDRMESMPRAKFFFTSTTFKQILENILPQLQLAWAEYGLTEYPDDPYGDYIIGKKPPSSWTKPYNAPRNWEHIILFKNGFAIQLMSMDKGDSRRGGSFDGGSVDEWAFVNQDYFSKVLIPSIRGNSNKFKQSPLHGGLSCYTSMPCKSAGNYIFEFKEKAKLYPETYFWSEANIYDNIVVIGEPAIQLMLDTMTYLSFELEVMNRRLTKLPDGFYPALDEQVHLYKPIYSYTSGSSWMEVDKCLDVDVTRPLDVSFDVGGKISCATVYQEHGRDERCVAGYHVKGEQKIRDLIDMICRKHSNKHFRIWGEPRAHDSNPIDETIFQIIKSQFYTNKRTAEIHAHSGVTPLHDLRHEFIDEVLKETNPNLPRLRFNEDSTKDTIIAMQSTGILDNFKKDKSKERNPNYPQEHAPHYTDTVDYFLMQKHYWKVNYAASQSDNFTGFI